MMVGNETRQAAASNLAKWMKSFLQGPGCQVLIKASYIGRTDLQRAAWAFTVEDNHNIRVCDEGRMRSIGNLM